MNGSNKDFDALLVSLSKELIDKTAEELNSTDTTYVEYPSKLDNKIKRKIKAEQNREKHVRYIRVFKNIAAVFMILCTATLFLCLSVDGVRAEIWNIVVDLTGGRTKVIVDTNVDVPNTILTFKEPAIEPEGLIKKVMWQAPDVYMICYLEREDDHPTDSIITYSQHSVSYYGGKILEGGGESIVEDVTVNNTSAKLLFRYYGNLHHIVLAWHDEEYIYSLSYKGENVDIDFLISMAESVK